MCCAAPGSTDSEANMTGAILSALVEPHTHTHGPFSLGILWLETRADVHYSAIQKLQLIFIIKPSL